MVIFHSSVSLPEGNSTIQDPDLRKFSQKIDQRKFRHWENSSGRPACATAPPTYPNGLQPWLHQSFWPFSRVETIQSLQSIQSMHAWYFMIVYDYVIMLLYDYMIIIYIYKLHIYIYWHMLNACKSTSLPPEVFDLGPPGQVVANAGGSWGDPADVRNDAKVQLTLERKGRSKGF